MTMSNDDISTPPRSRSGPSSRTRAAGRGPVIDQEGRELPEASLRTQFEGLRFDFGHSAANPFGDLTRRIEAEAGRNQMDAIDLLPLFRGFSGPDLWVHPADQHPNETAHRMVAERLVDYLASEGITPGKLPR